VFERALAYLFLLLLTAGLLKPTCHVVPAAMDAEIGRLKLQSMGIAIDVLSAAQQKYQDSWQEGT
jgi:adenosylhomocysteinase